MGESTRTDLTNFSQEDFEKVCRCCLSQESLFNLFELNYENLLICDIISQLFNIKVNFDDERPKNICESCIVQVVQFYQFKKNIEIIEEILSTKLENNHIHQPVKEEKLIDDASEEVSLEDTKFLQDLNEYKIPKTEDENLQTDSKTQSDEKEAKKPKRRFRYAVGNPKFVNKRYRHDSFPVQCPYCPEKFETAREYYIHRKLKLDKSHKPQHPCPICGKLYTSNHMAQHLRSHEQSRYQCEKCHVRFKYRPNLERHQKNNICEKLLSLTCEICEKNFMNIHALNAHKNAHTKLNYLCSVCGEDFTCKQTYVYHMKKHGEGKLQEESPETKPEFYVCEICTKEYKSKQSLENHVLTHSGKQFTCETCGKSFFLRSTLRTHFKTHDINKKEILKIKCTHCSLVFKNRSHYESHVKSLSNINIPPVNFPETRYRCHVCSNYFANKSSLNNHMGIHSEIKVLCSVCGKKFNSKTALKFHMITHTGEKRFSCTYCGKKCSTRGALRTHTFIHTGEKPHVCQICSKGFTQGPKLKIHMRTHTGERPYICPHCNKSFPTQSYLVVHIRAHTGETPYVCEVCSKGFYHSSSLTKHKQTHFKESQTKEGLNMEFEYEETVLD